MTDTCSICLEDLRSNLCTSISCGHCYHRDCHRRLVENYMLHHECQHPSEAKPSCPVCKTTIQKSIKVYLTVAANDSVVAVKRMNRTAVAAIKENSRLQERLRQLQQLSNDQSDLLLRVLPQYDRLEERHEKLKREKKLLKKQLETVEDENWELLFDCFDAQAKLKEAKEEREDIVMKLEETVDENKDLFAIWEALEDQLAASILKKREAKAKLKEQLRRQRDELDELKSEVDRNKSEKIRLKVDLKCYQEEVSKLNKKIKKVAKKFKRRSVKGSVVRGDRLPLKTYSGLSIMLSS